MAQEDTDLESHGKFRTRFEPEPRFEIVADLNGEKTTAYDRVTTYLIDATGTVRQVFPGMVRHRAAWSAVLHEVDALRDGDPQAAPR